MLHTPPDGPITTHQLVKDWQTNGGNQIRTELKQALSATQ
jgi:hypothetical protein